MSKTYIYCLVVIFVYILIIKPLNNKDYTDKKDSKTSKSKSQSKTKKTIKGDVNGDGKVNIQDEVDKIKYNSYTL